MFLHSSRVSKLESDNSQNVELEDYNNISVGMFSYFTTPSTYKDNLRVGGIGKFVSNFNAMVKQSALS